MQHGCMVTHWTLSRMGKILPSSYFETGSLAPTLSLARTFQSWWMPPQNDLGPAPYTKLCITPPAKTAPGQSSRHALRTYTHQGTIDVCGGSFLSLTHKRFRPVRPPFSRTVPTSPRPSHECKEHATSCVCIKEQQLRYTHTHNRHQQCGAAVHR